MQKFQKGKLSARASSSSQQPSSEDISMYSGLPKCTTRNPKWPEYHNTVLGELLLEQFVNENFCNGNMRREHWSILVAALNRRVGSTYTDSSVMIRFKNMKADFRTLYQLTNRSGWGWDEELHMPVATDELWDEIIQVYPKIAQYRRHPFHQYEVFEKICGENIATGSTSKRSSEEPLKTKKCSKKKSTTTNLNDLLVESNKNAVEFKEVIQRIDPYTMTDCLAKLGQLKNLTTQALLAIQDALKENKDNKAIFMTWEGDVLASWIEYIVSMHPRFYAAKVWL